MYGRIWPVGELASPVALHLPCGGDRDEGVRADAVAQWAGQQEARQEATKSIRFLLKKHQHPIHGLDTDEMMTCTTAQEILGSIFNIQLL